MSRSGMLLTHAAALALSATLATTAFAAKNSYDVNVIVSDGSVASPNVDSHLVNGWGVAFNPNGFVWVADNGTGLSTLYDGFGTPQSLVVSIPPAEGTGRGKPTGIVFSGSSDFVVASATRSGPSRFLFATEDGLIAGWAPNVDTAHAIRAYPPVGAPLPNAVYKGLALAGTASANFLYAADFAGGKIDVFDSTFTPVTMPGGFIDPRLPKHFAPFNIQAIGDHLIVTYAFREDGATDETAGPGLGVVNEFDATGHLLRRIAQHGRLNAPWGIALAPSTFGRFADHLLIGNFGDGTINAYDTRDGNFRGQLRGANDRVLHIDGLWGMAFGNDRNNQPKGTLFFAAGPDDETHGAYGTITPSPDDADDDDRD